MGDKRHESSFFPGDLVCIRETSRFSSGSKFLRSRHFYFDEPEGFGGTLVKVNCRSVFLVVFLVSRHVHVKAVQCQHAFVIECGRYNASGWVDADRLSHVR